MKRNLIRKVASLSICLEAILCSAVVIADSSSMAGDKFMAVLESADSSKYSDLLRTLTFSGYTNEQFYDLAEKLFLENLNEAERAPAKYAEAVWYARILARSGNEKYLSVLYSARDKEIKNKSSDFDKEMNTSALSLLVYREYNRIINGRESSGSVESTEEAMLVRMVKSRRYILQRHALKVINDKYGESEKYTDVAALYLEQNHQQPWQFAPGWSDMITMSIDILGKSGNQKYRELLMQVKKSGSLKKGLVKKLDYYLKKMS